ncbi:hypothetical protein CEK00_09515 [Stenotrophomonas maltophilia]|uniref:Flagellar motor switch protein FliN-like C-terminal domain-containing protein n=1 Tax=Stenotrophomonas maltophilia TaxID=40324 RepID=A0A270MXP8_STEMA|nr:FliM/FliN family flagellar motor switch protein [Stenotrophomonas maltophilia]PAM64663.1 hypothetical protein CEK00_21835 [Stenotrophomonas maltophilia]PAM71820.1 hypothetical protein CEK00_09515 [Stenotrophomonas maltophilia]
MNRTLSSLRQLVPAQHDRQEVMAWLERHGIPYGPQALPVGTCLRLEIATADGVVRMLVEANQWAKANCAALEGSAWELFPVETLHALVASCTQVPALPAPLSPDAGAACLGRASADAAQDLPAIRSSLGTAWIESIHSARGQANEVAAPGAVAGVTLELRLAPLTLSREAAAGLGCNDVLRLGALPACGSVWVGAHLLHTFIFKDKHVEIDSNLPSHSLLAQPGPHDDASSLGSLCITLDVVLAHVPITLNSLQGLGKGSVLELPPSAQFNVRVRDAGRLLAIGELVQIGDQLGVQLRSMATSS